MRRVSLLSAFLAAALSGCAPLPGRDAASAARAPAEWPELLPLDRIIVSPTPASPDPTAMLEARAAGLRARAAALRQADF